MVAHGRGGKTNALVSDAISGGGVQINAGDGAELDLPAGLFEGFAQGCLDQTFVGFQMAGRLVKYRSTFGQLFNHEKATVVFNQGGDGDVGREAHGMLLEWVADGSARLLGERG